MAQVLCRMCDGTGKVPCPGAQPAKDETQLAGDGSIAESESTAKCEGTHCPRCKGEKTVWCPGCLGGGLVDMPVFA